MPRRITPLINGEYYHVFNRGVEKRAIFDNKRSYQRFIDTICYYRFTGTPLKLSNFFRLSQLKRNKLLIDLQTHPKHITITCYVLMKNHFHFILKQETDGGISKFIKNLSDSYTKYFNTRNNRIGPLFQGQFKAIRVESDDQLLHLSRYIHLNPYMGSLLKSLTDLRDYSWSSLQQFIQTSDQMTYCDISPIIASFKNSESYWNFITDYVDYKNNIDIIKDVIFENPDVRSYSTSEVG